MLLKFQKIFASHISFKKWQIFSVVLKQVKTFVCIFWSQKLICRAKEKQIFYQVIPRNQFGHTVNNDKGYYLPGRPKMSETYKKNTVFSDWANIIYEFSKLPHPLQNAMIMQCATTLLSFIKSSN